MHLLINHHFTFLLKPVLLWDMGGEDAGSCLLCSANMTNECRGRRKKALTWLSASLTHLFTLQNTKYPETLVGI